MTEKEHGSVAMGDIRPAGHCDDDQAWHSFSAEYKNRSRADLGKGGMTDFALANAQFMCDRNSLDLIVYQTAVKERIRWLSIQLAAALGAPQPAHGTPATERVEDVAAYHVDGKPIRLAYTNWRGEACERTIKPRYVWFGATEWHPEPQWLLAAFDLEKDADRDFALKDFGRTPSPAPNAVTAGQGVEVKPITLNALKDYFTAMSWGDVPDYATALYSMLVMDGYIPKASAATEVRALLATPTPKEESK